MKSFNSIPVVVKLNGSGGVCVNEVAKDVRLRVDVVSGLEKASGVDVDGVVSVCILSKGMISVCMHEVVDVDVCGWVPVDVDGVVMDDEDGVVSVCVHEVVDVDVCGWVPVDVDE